MNPSIQERRFQVAEPKPLAGGRPLEVSTTCDICGQPRNTRKHRKQQKCSQIRQQMYRRAS